MAYSTGSDGSHVLNTTYRRQQDLDAFKRRSGGYRPTGLEWVVDDLDWDWCGEEHNLSSLQECEEELRWMAEVLRVLSASADGRYMGLSAHSIAPDVSSDSYDYFWGLMDRYGRYPLDLQGLKEEVKRV